MVDKDGKSSYSKIVSLTINATGQTLVIYPNPAHDKINISLSKAVSNAVIKVTNMAGKQVLKNTGVSGSNISLNVSQLPAGFYLIRIDDNGTISTVKFIKSSK